MLTPARPGSVSLPDQLLITEHPDLPTLIRPLVTYLTIEVELVMLMIVPAVNGSAHSNRPKLPPS